jgi:hypothetical protein
LLVRVLSERDRAHADERGGPQRVDHGSIRATAMPAGPDSAPPLFGNPFPHEGVDDALGTMPMPFALLLHVLNPFRLM